MKTKHSENRQIIYRPRGYDRKRDPEFLLNIVKRNIPLVSLLAYLELQAIEKGGKPLPKQVNQIREKNTNINTLIFWLGYDYVMVPYVRKKRGKGKSMWTLSKKIKLFIDTFVAF